VVNPSAIVLNDNHFQLALEKMYTEKKIENLLRQHGYKITSQRRVILKAITGVSEHMTPAEIHERVCRDDPGIGLVTVYRTLEILAGLGLICEMHVGGSYRSYLMRRPDEHHHHLVCSDCGTVIDFVDCDLSNLENKLAKDNNFKIDGHILEFIGRCRVCRSRVKLPVVRQAEIA
jgi:Fur family ferric uptake transcriptional regulator